ncbi:MAG: DUF1326 domain-containing protein [Candidatus Rokubacteria bacterium]|nr:DUF1326 domain-containing protein [Candidatus Rokubacteria bacterium]
MATIKWRLKGKYLKNCNCDPGCPCEFWARPTHGGCEGMLGMQVEEGYYGKTSMKGIKFAVQYRWPGPLHEGNGTVLPILDERSSPAQREAVLQILSGKAGNAWFEVVASLVTKVLEPKIGRIEFKHDLKRRKARVVVPGLLETSSEPIKDLVTGGAHVVDVLLPKGMEYKKGVVCQATVNRSTSPIAYDWPASHSSLAHVEHTHAGLSR